MKLTIADLTLDLSLDGFLAADALVERYRYFPGQGAADWRLELEPVPPTDDPVDEFRLQEPEKGVFRFVRRDMDVLLREGTLRGWIQDSDHSFDMLLRGLLNIHAAASGRLMCHAAILARAGRAAVFLGREGAGKTTLCRAAPAEWQVLSDEVAFLEARGPRAAGSPFLGEIHGPRSADFQPLERIGEILGHGPYERKLRGSVASMPALLRHTINFGPGTSLSAKFFATAARLAGEISVDALQVPESGFWEFYNE